MYRLAIVFVLGLAGTAHADGVFDVCKGESKTVVPGTGQMSIAVIYPDDFPGRTTRQVLYPIGARLAIAEHAKILLGAEVDAALKLVAERHWSEAGNACSTAPSLEAVLGQKHSNITTARASIACDDAGEVRAPRRSRAPRPAVRRALRALRGAARRQARTTSR